MLILKLNKMKIILQNLILFHQLKQIMKKLLLKIKIILKMKIHFLEKIILLIKIILIKIMKK